MTSISPGYAEEALSFSALDGTPRLLPKNHASPTRYWSDQSSNFNLRLANVIGNTVSSVNGFAWTDAKPRFATCAGSVVVLHAVDDELNVSQRFFRARPTNHVQTNGADPTTPSKSEMRKSMANTLRTSNIGFRAAAAASPSQDQQTTPSRAAARMGTRSTTCVALSPDGNLMAAGETGYSPRVLLFSCSEEASGFPFATLSEHGFGVKCVAFSPDSRYLCSVGDTYDNFILLWTLSSRNIAPKLQATNRCTSTVHDIAWMGKSIITVGTRHVKIWRPDFPSPPSPAKQKFRSDGPDSPSTPGSKPLAGRNCLLGQMLDSTFTCVGAISDIKAVIGTDKGDICLLDDTGAAQKLYRICRLPFGVQSLAVDRSKQEIWVAGGAGQSRCLAFSEVHGPIATPGEVDFQSESSSPKTRFGVSDPDVVAMGLLPHQLVVVDSNHHVHFRPRSLNGGTPYNTKSFRSHQGAVLGAHSLPAQSPDEPSFMTFDSTGTILFWDRDACFHSEQRVPLDQLRMSEEAEENELKIVRAVGTTGRLISGDKYGVLRLLSGNVWDESAPIKAHQGEINDISVCQMEDGCYSVATCGRDRVIQIFDCRDNSLELIQSIDQHASTVHNVSFTKKGAMLLSASSDRTVGVFALARTEDSKAYIALRLLTLKQTPVSLTLDASDDSVIIVATMDKQLHVYNIETGQCLSTSRLADERTGTSIVLSSTAVRSIRSGWSGLKTVIGVSSTDKSIRVHDLETGSTLMRDYGHSEGVSSAAVISEPQEGESPSYKLASTGLDGTIMLWELTYTPPAPPGDASAPTSPVHESPALPTQPLRRVLSRSQLADFTRSLEASGMSPMASTPSRQPSPSRLRKRLSNYSLNSAPSPKLSTPRLRPRAPNPERSPSPPSPATPGAAGARKPMIRTRSVGNFNDLNYAAEQLCRSLKQIRKKMAVAGAGEAALSAAAAEDLERELAATVKSVGRLTKRRQSASDNNLGDLLDQYSDKLAELVGRKMSLGGVLERVETAKSDTAVVNVVDSGRVSPSKLDRVTESPEVR